MADEVDAILAYDHPAAPAGDSHRQPPDLHSPTRRTPSLTGAGHADR